jgi:hypothetical protein
VTKGVKNMERFVVVKSLTRRNGYSIQAPPNITWATRPQNTFGWYRYKSDAQKRADEFNQASWNLLSQREDQ